MPRAAAALLSCALVLVPANLLVSGVVRFGAAVTETLSAQPNDRPGEVDLKPHQLEQLLYVAATAVAGLAVLMIGLSLAQAALVPVLLGTARRPSQAWAVVGARFGALFS